MTIGRRSMDEMTMKKAVQPVRLRKLHEASFSPWIIPLFLALLGFSGCGGEEGPPRLQISGRVSNAGEPLQVEGRDVGVGMVVVEFYPVDEGGNASQEPLETAHVSESGEFNLVDGIPPGRYRIAVRQWDPYPQVDRLDGRFSRENTQIVRELTSDDRTLEIDVSRPEG